MVSPSTKIADKLLQSGAITKEKYQEALSHLENHGQCIEESLLEIRAIDEDSLLKHLSTIYKTRYVTTDKLRRAEIPTELLKKVPLKLVNKHNVFPIMFDEKNSELFIISADPNNLVAEEEITKASGVPKVRTFLARPAAIKAAIAKFYRGDIHAFSNLDKEGYQEFHNMLDIYERQVLDEESMVMSLASVGTNQERMISAEEMKEAGPGASGDSSMRAAANLDTTIEMLRVMVSLLDSSRGDLAGHSVQTSQHAQIVCRRIGLSNRETAAISMAALLHDLGKGGTYHLTAFNAAEWDGHRTAAEKRFENPLRLFQSIGIPEMTRLSLKHMYERYDGNGFPDGMKGKDIPLGARILAMSDTFADLTANQRNPYRRMLSTEEAIQVLGKIKNKVLDANLVDLFAFVVAGDDIKRQLLTGAQAILLVDPDAEQSAILDLQLTSRGFRVLSVRTSDTAFKTLVESKANMVLCEVDLEPIDGFKLKERLNQDKRTREIPFVYFTSRAASDDVERGFHLGAQDYLLKPLTVDVLVAKMKKYLKERTDAKAGGVSGSLKEMSLPDLVQILSHGRKTGQIKLTMEQHRGEIHFVDGEIYNAFFDQLRGEEAIFQMLKHKEGTFVLDPSFQAESRVINMTSEMLLLEGMRRLDEEGR